MDKTLDLSDILFKGVGLHPGECSGKVAVITGAGRGIGLQIARAFACLGGKVVIAEISEETGRAAEAKIQREDGEVAFIQTDVSDPVSVQNLAVKVHDIFGQVEVLVNNAIHCPVSPVARMELELWDKVMAVNLRGTFLITRTFLPELLERSQGVIVNMVSTDAMPGLSAYIASKQGILGFSQTLASEIGSSGVKVIAFGPGMVDTPGIRGTTAPLAPLLGISEDQFLHLSLHSAYEGLMPAEHAGAAAAYLVLRLSDEFHGEMVTGYEILERTGLISGTSVPFALSADSDSSLLTENDHASVQSQIEKLIEIIGATAEEFEKLPFFARPMARNGFKSKTGMNIETWRDQLTIVRDNFRDGAQKRYQISAQSLDHLARYYQGIPQEMARFTRDTNTIEKVSRLSAARVAVIKKLLSTHGSQFSND